VNGDFRLERRCRGPLKFACILCSAAVAVASSGCRAATAQLTYEPSVVTLKGTLRYDEHFGPPNYGESPTDPKIRVPVLYLDRPVDVREKPATPDDPDQEGASNVSSIQIVGETRAMTIEGCLQATGSLTHAVSGGHFTPVLLVLTSAQPSSGCSATLPPPPTP